MTDERAEHLAEIGADAIREMLDMIGDPYYAPGGDVVRFLMGNEVAIRVLLREANSAIRRVGALEAEVGRLQDAVITRCRAPYEDEYGEHSCEPPACRIAPPAADHTELVPFQGHGLIGKRVQLLGDYGTIVGYCMSRNHLRVRLDANDKVIIINKENIQWEP